MLDRLISTRHPAIPLEVIHEASNAVDIFKTVPIVKEVRLFGSAIKGTWDPNRSDIDIAAIIAGHPLRWSAFMKVRVGAEFDWRSQAVVPVLDDHPDKKRLFKEVKDHCPRVELSIVTENDFNRIYEEEKALRCDPNLATDIRNGKLLYSNPIWVNHHCTHELLSACMSRLGILNLGTI